MGTDHIQMLCDISELNHIFSESINIDDFLDCIVKMVAQHMLADVCSIYLYDENSSELVLKATKGLNPDSINNVRLKLNEGLVGQSMKELKPVHEQVGKNNPKFKFIPGIFEEKFESFLAVPIKRARQRIGVLVIQRGGNKFFDNKDIMALQATSSQLASMIENINILMAIREKKDDVKRAGADLSILHLIKGVTASEGFAHANAVISGIKTHYAINYSPGDSYTLTDFDRALKETETQLEDLQERVGEKLSDSASLIFSSHLLMLKDRGFTGVMRNLIEDGEEPVKAVDTLYRKYADIFSKSPNRLVKEKVQDIEDLVNRIIDNLTSRKEKSFTFNKRIVVAKNLYPSDLLMMSAEGVEGIILVGGGATSHISILARSLRIPLIIADNADLLNIPHNVSILMDGKVGNIYINPSDDVIAAYREHRETYEKLLSQDELILKPAETTDGFKISLLANINLLSDMDYINNKSIDGIGLYRTEFPFLIRDNFPSEEEQYRIYKKLNEKNEYGLATFRTLDIGGDKVLSYYNNLNENNPFLGMRSIRFSLTHLDIFKEQIRAILRAGAGSDLRIMFPMISSVDDLTHSRKILTECMEELDSKVVPFNKNPGVGIMVELPSAVFIIDELADLSDFFSIGTNDLIQYTLAVDRTNEKVAHLYLPHHPAVLKSIKKVADAAIEHKIDLSVCGEMGNNSKYLPFLIGIGIRSFSVDSGYIPQVKNFISQISLKASEEYAGKLLEASRIDEIEKIINSDLISQNN